MVKIVKEPMRIRCQNKRCAALLEFEKEDCRVHTTKEIAMHNVAGRTTYIICPVCGKNVYVDEFYKMLY